MRKPSTKQMTILSFLQEYMRDHSYPPSIREICSGCGISSTSVVEYNLNLLERAGYIRRDREISRGIELIEGERARMVKVPLIGTIAAGTPIPVPTAETWRVDGEETLDLPEDMTNSGDGVYALRVRGTSMIDALINDGDIVLMKAIQVANNGEMVAAWLKAEKETTLKRFYQEDGRVRLEPANSTMRPIYVDADNLEIQGKVIGVIRRL